MDQSICASLSHTHYWYEVGMLKDVVHQEENIFGRQTLFCLYCQYLRLQSMRIPALAGDSSSAILSPVLSTCDSNLPVSVRSIRLITFSNN